jgi:hypothetical protein
MSLKLRLPQHKNSHSNLIWSAVLGAEDGTVQEKLSSKTESTCLSYAKQAILGKDNIPTIHTSRTMKKI